MGRKGYKGAVLAKKKYGQNFLNDKRVLSGIIECSGVGPKDHVLEIGPGRGALTELLCENAAHVTAVEIDSDLIPVLNVVMTGYDNFRLIQADILKTDIEAIAKDTLEDGAFRVIANLPYYITTPVITMLLEKRLPIDSITVMVQKEVAERMAAAPGSRDCGAISLAVQYYAEMSIEIEVPPECFNPRPKVSSCVVNLIRRKEPPVMVKDEKLMFSLIRASFNQRRKTLANGLANGLGFPIEKADIINAITSIGYPETVRGEALGLKEFAKLSDILGEYR